MQTDLVTIFVRAVGKGATEKGPFTPLDFSQNISKSLFFKFLGLLKYYSPTVTHGKTLVYDFWVL